MASDYGLIAEYDAKGGPAQKGRDQAGNSYGPTPAGDFVIAKCARHHDSTLYPAWSTLPWGIPIREHNEDVEYRYGHDTWESLTALWNKKKVFEKILHRAILASETVELVKDYHNRLYATPKVPSTWVFNDFGHMTCYFFKDINHDGIFNPKTEKLQSQYIHTTPKDEATATDPTQAIVLDTSHGCIHVKPNDIDEMIQNGFLKRGNRIFVHSYSDIPPNLHPAKGHPPYELHFYPVPGVLQVRCLLHSARKAH